MEEILRKLVAFPTITGDETAVHQALDYIAGFVVARGMHVERFDSNGFESIIATTIPGNKKPTILLGAHLDVVPAAEDMFILREDNGTFYGRGTLDMKGAIAAYLQIIDDLQDTLSDYDFGLMITSDEETGGENGVRALLDEGYEPKVCVLPDGGDDWQIQVHSKGLLYAKIVVYGKPAHGSRPWLGDNANLTLLNIIGEIQRLFPDPSPDTNTMNLGQIKGGDAVNQVADYAEATIDIRVTSEHEKTRIIKALQTICDQSNVELIFTLNGAVGEFSLTNLYIKPFAECIEQVTGVKVKGSRTLGSNDGRYFAAKHIPCISFYPTGGGHHGPEEWLDKQAFHQMKDVIRNYLEKIAK